MRFEFALFAILAWCCAPAYAGMTAAPASLEQMKTDAGLRFEGRASGPSAVLAEPPAMGELQDMAERAGRIDGLHSEPIIKPRWLPKFVRDVPAWRTVEGPTQDKEGFFQRLWRAPASLFIGPIGGMIDNARQWSAVAWSGGDKAGAVIGAVGGGLFGLIAGAVIGIAGAVLNAALAVKNLATGRL